MHFFILNMWRCTKQHHPWSCWTQLKGGGRSYATILGDNTKRVVWLDGNIGIMPVTSFLTSCVVFENTNQLVNVKWTHIVEKGNLIKGYCRLLWDLPCTPQNKCIPPILDSTWSIGLLHSLSFCSNPKSSSNPIKWTYFHYDWMTSSILGTIFKKVDVNTSEFANSISVFICLNESATSSMRSRILSITLFSIVAPFQSGRILGPLGWIPRILHRGVKIEIHPWTFWSCRSPPGHTTSSHQVSGPWVLGYRAPFHCGQQFVKCVYVCSNNLLT